ncbi:MAG TPA: N-acetyl-gamma-glutamyl-phosphate reductase [Flavilitoribacter sp.]|nr:N-acetyl-gamma-glutamyl-phosphate reductase [Flavilitoribacter sp.]
MSASKIKVGIIGAAGYTAGELLRILLEHPDVAIAFAQSSSNAGAPVWKVHADLAGDTDLVFSDRMPEEPDVLFLCSGHGKSKTYLAGAGLPDRVKIIDLSADFRIEGDGNDFVYGLPELNKAEIIRANKIANPGCFATAIQLALLPLAKAGLLQDEVHINAITGSTGAGQEQTLTSHFSWRQNNISIYKPFQHQHLAEIGQSLRRLQPGFDKNLNFIPVRGNFARGIFASVYTRSDLDENELTDLYTGYYQDAAFTVVTPENPSLKQVVNTNKCIVHIEKHGDKILIVSAIDNLLKGASGQAVQNMNLMFGLSEGAGLRLKAMAF